MNEIGEMELKFAELIWPRAPIGSGELVALCENEFGWKKSTTYTMLKRLEKRGLFENTDSVVRVKMTREEFDAGRSERFVKENFGGIAARFPRGIHEESEALGQGHRRARGADTVEPEEMT